MTTITVRNSYHRFHPARYIGYRIWKLFSYVGMIVVIGGIVYFAMQLGMLPK